ncbi:serine hydrolase domain-containing protein [Lysobacter gummosus]
MIAARRIRWCLLACLSFAVPAFAADPAVERVLARWDGDTRADLKAVVVLRDGELIAERYYNGDDARSLHDMRSAGKSVTALLAGIALDQGRIGSLDDPIERYLPAARGKPVAGTSVRDLLTMRSGLDADDTQEQSPGNEDRLDEAADPAAFALGVPRREVAGTRYQYNSLNAYLAGWVVAAAVAQPLDEFARANLFQPLGIEHWQWQRDASGHAKGQGNLSLSARDMAAIGEWVLDGGEHAGRRLISRKTLDDILAPRIAIAAVDPFADHYGYFWYLRTQRIAGRDVPVAFASGNGGNKIYVVPSLRAVIAITSSAYGRGYGQRRSQDILRAVLAAMGPAASRDLPAAVSAREG